MTRIVDDRELPLGKRTKLYRFFEILPGFLTYSMLALVVILSIVQPLWAAIYILLVILAMFVRTIVAWRCNSNTRESALCEGSFPRYACAKS